MKIIRDRDHRIAIDPLAGLRKLVVCERAVIRRVHNATNQNLRRADVP